MAIKSLFFPIKEEHTKVLDHLLLLYRHEINAKLGYRCVLNEEGFYAGYNMANEIIESGYGYIICVEGYQYDRELAGFVLFDKIGAKRPNTVYLSDIYILPRYRGMAFMDLVPILIRDIPEDDLEFKIWAHNNTAQRVYERLIKKYGYEYEIIDELDSYGTPAKRFHIYNK